MTDILVEVENSSSRLSRPSLAQVRTVVEFMQKHPELGNGRLSYGKHKKFRKLWTELSNVVNSMEGSFKSTKGWIKFWSDKKRGLKLKQNQIKDGKLKEKLSSLEQKILDLSCDEGNFTKKKKGDRVKQEPCNGNDVSDNEDDSPEDIYKNDGMEFNQTENSITVTESDERQINLMEKLVEVMNQQASAMSQIAQASLSNSQALESLADASHIQALAVDRLANTFENVSAAVHEVRNAIVSIDYTMKRCYSASAAQHRQNSNLFT